RAVQHLQRVGHFEFGVDRRPINTGDAKAVEEITELWRRGEEVRGWARYWATVHGYLADLLDRDADVAARSKLVRYEALCGAPVRVIASVLDHCALPRDGAVLDHAAHHIHFPSYYRPRFSEQDLATIAEETAAVACRFGYHACDIEAVPQDADHRAVAVGR
ncbi:MAG: sulfotransferase, partial [Alphaproteobacteria bacterium]